ncbi:hypothetical protein CE91St56_29910 [Lachnospiraceae bacterium]|nr:hypothetical protein CE91St56_29910 [Lachnospiraceae bacterium]GKH41937.1 hypothetical protein CE91St57_29110 [Lachnospiraceae bacterium]
MQNFGDIIVEIGRFLNTFSVGIIKSCKRLFIDYALTACGFFTPHSSPCDALYDSRFRFSKMMSPNIDTPMYIITVFELVKTYSINTCMIVSLRFL